MTLARPLIAEIWLLYALQAQSSLGSRLHWTILLVLAVPLSFLLKTALCLAGQGSNGSEAGIANILGGTGLALHRRGAKYSPEAAPISARGLIGRCLPGIILLTSLAAQTFAGRRELSIGTLSAWVRE